ncbi:MAG: thioredoxin-dependent thiol peroxidase [Candidatus Binatia bacterium]
MPTKSTKSTKSTAEKTTVKKAPMKSPMKKTPAAKAKPKAAAAGKLQIGDKVPSFALADQSGATHALADHKGRKLLIYFYPKADTPGCTTQSCSVRDARRDFAKQGVDVVGISPDKSTAQQKFDTKYSLGFPLLADTDHAVAESFGVWGEKSMYGRKYMGIVRSAFLIDEKGKITGAWYGVSPKDTVPGALAAL